MAVAPSKPFETGLSYSRRLEALARFIFSVTSIAVIALSLATAAIAEFVFGLEGALLKVWGVAGPAASALATYYLAVQRNNGNGH
jgi:hypothetical protein